MESNYPNFNPAKLAEYYRLGAKGYNIEQCRDIINKKILEEETTPCQSQLIKEMPYCTQHEEEYREIIKDGKEWVVVKKGEPDCGSFEISVVKSSNKHGIISYGWHGVDKLHISDAVTSGHQISKQIWDKLVQVAQDVADELNAKENKI